MTDAVETFQNHIRSIADDQQQLERFFTQVKTPDDLVAYATNAGCPLDTIEAEKLFEQGQTAYNKMQSQLSDDDLDKVVGGINFGALGVGIWPAVGIALRFMTEGVATAAIATAVSHGGKTVGGVEPTDVPIALARTV